MRVSSGCRLTGMVGIGVAAKSCNGRYYGNIFSEFIFRRLLSSLVTLLLNTHSKALAPSQAASSSGRVRKAEAADAL